jgi:N-terminal half of MaoC dehydratase
MESFTFPVEAGHIMCFARALGDEGRSAPPTFVAAAAQFDPDWPYRPRPGQPWHGSGRDPGTAPAGTGTGGGTSLHAEQHYEYHRELRPGDVLTVERSDGATWEKQSARAGLLRFSEEITHFTDAAGDLVVTARRVRVVTERPVEG